MCELSFIDIHVIEFTLSKHNIGKTLHHLAAADLPQMNGSIIVKCMLTFSIVVVTHGVNAATVSFIQQQRALSFRKAIELFYCDSYYAWMFY